MIAAPLPIPTRRFGRGAGPPALRGGGNVATPTPTPTPPGAGNSKPFVERVPEAAGVSDRLRRHTEKVASILNSLMSSGVLVQTGPSSWTIDAAALSNSAGGLTGTFNSGTFGGG